MKKLSEMTASEARLRVIAALVLNENLSADVRIDLLRDLLVPEIGELTLHYGDQKTG